MILPGSTIGMIGGGQLGRMFSFEAKRNGYKVIVLDPSKNCPTGQVVDEQIVAEYTDLDAAKQLAEKVDVITYEFENIDVEVVRAIAKIIPVYPGVQVLEASQHRVKEKQAVEAAGLQVAPYTTLATVDDVEQAIQNIGLPAVIKTCRLGYDGKGQAIVRTNEEAIAAVRSFSGEELILEKLVDFDCEISVICSRNTAGETVTFPVGENIHVNNILDTTIVPARITDDIAEKARALALRLADSIELVGTFAVEMFVLPNGDIIINEMAPRPHNSGHYTIEGCDTSQFENQLRAICGLPLGSTNLRAPAVVMKNILGQDGTAQLAHTEQLFRTPRTYLHLYGKTESKTARKMGHFTILGESMDTVLPQAQRLGDALRWT